MDLLTHLKRVGKQVYSLWIALAHALGYVNTKVLLTVFYILIIGPVSIVCAVLGIDFLDRRWKKKGSYWKQKEPVDHSSDAARHQF